MKRKIVILATVLCMMACLPSCRAKDEDSAGNTATEEAAVTEEKEAAGQEAEEAAEKTVEEAEGSESPKPLTVEESVEIKIGEGEEGVIR